MFDPCDLRGWCHAGPSEDVRRSGVRTVRRFGRDLVLFRGASGQLTAAEATCPHLGAHLGGGTVHGECLRCPFHGWSFGPDGAARHIPLAKRIPSAGRLRTLPVVECGGVVFVYHPAPGDDPTVPAPQLPARLVDRLDGRVDRRIRSTAQFPIHGSLLEVMENAADRAHFPVVHRGGVRAASPYRWEVDDDGTLCLETDLQLRFPPMPASTRIEMFDAFNSVVTTKHRLLERRREHIDLFTLVAPTGERSIDVLFLISSPGGIPVVDRISHRFIRRTSIRTALEDRAIWEGKVHLERPVLSDADGPILAFRRWHRRFAEPLDAAIDLRSSAQPTLVAQEVG